MLDAPTMADQYVFVELSDPDRVEVRDATDAWLATFTEGAYTVSLIGTDRTFTEKDLSVTHARWIRTCATPFEGGVDVEWLEAALDANEKLVPDILAIAMQYIRNAPALFEG